MSMAAPAETVAVPGAAPRLPALSGSMNQAVESFQPNKAPTRMRREKYTARACVECQQRKVKCSGEDTCRQCDTRKVACVYSQNKDDAGDSRRKAKRRRQEPEVDDGSLEDVQAGGAQEHPIASAQLDAALQARVARLEADLRSVTQSGQSHHRQSASQSNSYFPDPHVGPSISSLNTEERDDANASNEYNMVRACDGEPDTFNILVRRTQSLSLSSQLASLRKTLGLGAMSIGPRSTNSADLGFSWELPAPAQLRRLFEIYFRDFECYLPYLDQTDTERRVFHMLGQLDYGEHNQRLYIESRHYPLAALICNILAMAESLDPKSVALESRPGWSMYLQGCKLIERCSSEDEFDFDLIRYYAIGSGYLMHAERLRAATHAISRAIQLAAKVRLNDQDAWLSCSTEEKRGRKKLWWTIYFMDRRIGQKNGTAYLIRDTEYSVDDFSAETTGHGASAAAIEWNATTSRAMSPPGPDSSDYLQTLIKLGKLWGQIWDQFFAVTAPSRGNWQEIMAMDERIVALQQGLPPHLRWDASAPSLQEEQNEPQMRRRLTTLTRINTLRLIIRQNPLVEYNEDADTTQFCADLASLTISAIARFNRRYPCSRPCGYFISASLVECICQLVPLLQTSCPAHARAAAAESFRTAYKILVELARIMNSANRAIKALNSVFSVGEVVSLFKNLVAETEKTNAEASMPVRPQPGATTNRLPTSVNQNMGALQWPSSLDFLPMLPEESTRRQMVTQNRGHTQPLDQPNSRNPSANQTGYILDTSMFSPSSYDDSVHLENNQQSSGDGDYNYDQFMYGDFAAERFT